MPQFVGKATPAVTINLFAYNEAGSVWNGAAYVAWNNANYAAYKQTTTEGSPGRYYATLPAGAYTWELATDVAAPLASAGAHADAVEWLDGTAASEGMYISAEGNSYSASDEAG